MEDQYHIVKYLGCDLWHLASIEDYIELCGADGDPTVFVRVLHPNGMGHCTRIEAFDMALQWKSMLCSDCSEIAYAEHMQHCDSCFERNLIEMLVREER